MMINKNHHHIKLFTRAASRLAGGALLWAICYTPVYAETKIVVAEGSSDYCFAPRERAQELARGTATNDAHDECDALGPGWTFTGNTFQGYEQCLPCKDGYEFKCTVKQALYMCSNTQKEQEEKEKAAKERAEKEQEEKAAKERTENEAAAKVAKEEAERKKIERVAQVKATESNAIEDAFSKMEKQTEKALTPKAGNIDDEFEKVGAYRTEQEQLKIAALKAKEEQEARDLELKGRHDEAKQFCTEAVKSENSCFESACGSKPAETICTEQREHTRSSNCPFKGGCIVFPTYTCISTGPNPKYSEWESCTRNLETKCTAGGTRLPSVEECVSQREQEAPASTSDTPVIQQLKSKMKDLLKCNPEAGEKCPPRRNHSNPGGVRG